MLIDSSGPAVHMPPNPQNLKPFKPGQSGNPKGREKGSHNRATIAMKWLGILTKHKNLLTGIEEQLSMEDKMTLSLIKKAIEDQDVNAYKAVMDSAYGTPKQTTETKIETDDHIVLRFVNAEVPGHTTPSGTDGSTDEA